MQLDEFRKNLCCIYICSIFIQPLRIKINYHIKKHKHHQKICISFIIAFNQTKVNNKYHTGRAGGFITALKGQNTGLPLKGCAKS
jgi:hypothetical protein